MRNLLLLVFGVVPVIVLGLLATTFVLGGLGALFDDPGTGALLFFWGLGGWIGAWSMLRAAFGRFSNFTATGLVIGIVAAAPLGYYALNPVDVRTSLFIGYWTISPVLVAAYLLGQHFRLDED